MSRNLYRILKSPRNHIAFDKVPTRRGHVYGDGGYLVESTAEYGQTLDCVYEMTRDTADANGIPYSQAVGQVLHTNNWTVLPTHQRTILERLEAGL